MEKWLEKIDSNTQDLIKTLGQLSIKELNWKPNANTWSIAQNIDHLIVINNTYFPVIKSLRKGTYKLPFIANFGFIVSFLGKTILGAVQPDRKKKIKTFPVWEPATSDIPAGILDKFQEHQTELKHMMKDASDLVEKGVVISSPANRNIVYKLETAFDIIVLHEQRHFNQAKEVFQLLQEKTSS